MNTEQTAFVCPSCKLWQPTESAPFYNDQFICAECGEKEMLKNDLDTAFKNYFGLLDVALEDNFFVKNLMSDLHEKIKTVL